MLEGLEMYTGLLMASFFVYSYIVFMFIGILLGFENVKKIPICLLSIVNVIATYYISTKVSGGIITPYIYLYALLFIESWLLFKAELKSNLFISITVVLHILVFHTVISAGISWGGEVSIYQITNNIDSNTLAWLITTVILSVATMAFRKVMPMSKVMFVMRNDKQCVYQTAWMATCVGYLLYNAIVFRRDVFSSYTYVDQILKCATILIGVYVMLIYNLKLSELFGYKEKSEDLTAKLSSNVEFLEAITGRKSRKYEINVTQDEFCVGIFEDVEKSEREWKNYSIEFSNLARSIIFGEDVPEFLEFVNRKKLLEIYKEGRRELLLHYRVKVANNSPRWHRLYVSLTQTEGNDDVLAFAYSVDVNDEYEEKKILYEQAQLDLMTGIYNRSTFESLVTEELRKGRGILIMVDLDHFKPINDLLGHDYGDQVIKNIVGVLKESFREDDIVGRFGGDEFMVYVKDSCEYRDIFSQVDNVLRRASTAVRGPNGVMLYTSVSIGVAEIVKPMKFEDAFKCADIALYEAKNGGKNRCRVYEGTKVKTSGVS